MPNAADGATPVFGPTGAPLTHDDLPPPTLRRWVTRRKAEVVMAVRAGVIDRDEACRRYGLTAEEFLSWQRLLEDHGLQGLRATRLQDYRGPVPGAVAGGEAAAGAAPNPEKPLEPPPPRAA